jgi:cytochrome c oxidase cbb3-type subunit 1
MFSVIWAVLGMAAGVYVAAELVWPNLDFGQRWLSFGRLRTLHTNGVIFGFGVSALMGTAFYSVQRTCHVPLFAPGLAWFCCFAWQIGVLLGGIGMFCNRVLRHDCQKKNKTDICFQLVLWWADHRHCNAAHR